MLSKIVVLSWHKLTWKTELTIQRRPFIRIHCHTAENAMHYCIMKSWTEFTYMLRTNSLFGNAFFYCVLLYYLHQHLVEFLLQLFHTSIMPLELNCNVLFVIVQIVYCLYIYIYCMYIYIYIYIFPSYAVKWMCAYIPELLPDWSRTCGIN